MKNILYFILTVLIISCNNSNNNNLQNELTDNREINLNNKTTKSITTKSNKKLNSQASAHFCNDFVSQCS